jgi:hypothetical protein
VDIHEEKVFTHLDEEKERDIGTWVLDTGKMNHVSGCRAAFMKIDTTVLDTLRFDDNSVVRIEGRDTVMFMCNNGESWFFDGVYFIPRLMTNIVSVGQLDEIGYKIDIDTGVMKIREPGGDLLSHPVFKAKNQMLIVCMPRIKLSYIRSEYKHRIPMSLLYRILLQKFITSPERTKQRNGPHLATDS